MIPVLALLIGFLPLIAVRYWLDRKIEKNWKHSPLGTDMLRPPGYSLRKEITQIDDDMLTWICLLVTSPILWTAMFLSLVFVGGYPNRSLALISTVCFGAVAYAVFARKVWALKKKRTNLVLGYEGELATAQHLDLLMLEGCRVFHDMECNCGNIDHIVVSRSGVFSINSKGYSKPQKTSQESTILSGRCFLLERKFRCRRFKLKLKLKQIAFQNFLPNRLVSRSASSHSLHCQAGGLNGRGRSPKTFASSRPRIPDVTFCIADLINYLPN